MQRRIDAFWLLLLMPSLAAALGLEFKPSAHVEVQRDGNIYRAPDSPPPGAPPKVADVITTVGGGARLTLRESLQELEVQADADHDRYGQLSTLDNTRYAIDALARLALGSTLRSNIEASRKRQLENFAYTDNTDRGFITTDTDSADLRYALAARMSVAAKFTHTATTASLPSSRDYDLNDNTAEVGADYLRSGFSSLGFAVRLGQGEYPNRPIVPGSGVEQSYRQQTALLRARYAPSGLSDLNLQLGLTKRTHDDPSVPDFHGLTGRVSYLQRFSGKTQWRIDAYRDLYYIADAEANYVENLGLRLAVDYQYSAKLALALAAEQYRANYRGTPLFSVVGTPRQDDVSAVKLGVEYRPFYRMKVLPQWRWEQRHSNQSDRDYRFSVVGIDLAYDYGRTP
jgi:Putative beta-barrel porin 2